MKYGIILVAQGMGQKRGYTHVFLRVACLGWHAMALLLNSAPRFLYHLVFRVQEYLA